MLVLKLDDSYYLTHSEDVGWDYTSDIYGAKNLYEWQIKNFTRDFKRDGFIQIQGVDFDKLTILELELTIKNATKIV